jgi:ribonuclease P protein component
VNPPTSRQFGKSRRLRRRAEFQQVFDNGQRMRGRFLTLLVTPSRYNQPRLGIVASKKLGDSVRRNRAKRLIREVFRHTPNPAALDRVDIVVIPRTELFNASYASLEEDYRTALARSVARLGDARTPKQARTEKHGR